MALAPLRQRHRKSRLYGVAHGTRIVGIDEQGGTELARRAGERRQDQNAGIFRILRSDEFFRDEIHAVAQRRDEPDIRGAEEP